MAFRRSVCGFLSSRSEWEVCGEALDGQEAVEKAADLRPDVVLLDVNMPRLDGLTAAPLIKQAVPEAEILMVSQHDPEHFLSRALEAGASGFISKSNLARELLPAIEGIARHSGHFCPGGAVAAAVANAPVFEERRRRAEALTEPEIDQKVQARTRELEQQSERLRQMCRNLMQTQDDERRRIARELHDSVGQTLSALGLNLALADQRLKGKDPELDELIRDSEHLIQQLSQEIRTANYLLHPPLLDENGLADALQSYVQGVSERSGLDLSLTVDKGLGRLSRELELAAFRIIQEALNNVIRHSGSRTAEIRVSREAGAVSIEVQDEGKGIAREELDQIQSRNSGVGINGMRERAFQFGGGMNIESNGRGTKISVKLPASTDASQFATKSPLWGEKGLRGED